MMRGGRRGWGWSVVAAALLALLMLARVAAAEPIVDKDLGFRTAIPDGFVPVKAAVRGDVLYAYRREGVTRAQLGTAINIERLRGVLGREKLKPEDIARNAPGATILELPWKSFTVQAIRRELDVQGKPAVAYTVQIPLKPEAIQITVLGDVGSEDSVQGVVRGVLGETEGPSNWLTDGERAHALGYGIGKMLGIALLALGVIWAFRKLRS